MLNFLLTLLTQVPIPDPAWQMAERIATGGGLLGYIFGGLLVADRFGLLRRKNGVGGIEIELLRQLVANTSKIGTTLDHHTELLIEIRTRGNSAQKVGTL